MLYNSRSPACVNELRYKLFCATKGEGDSWQLPPCEASLFKHCLLAKYQAGIWKRCLDIPNPIGHGWCLETTGREDYLAIDWLDVQPTPEAVLQLLSCRCSRKCKLPTCKCLVNNLKCTEMCRLKTCANQADIDELDEEDINIEEDDYDDDF